MQVFIQGGGKATLTKADYVASGGQARVFAKGKTAFKIYHDPKAMMPIAKVHELKRIQDPRVNRPHSVVLDQRNNPIGYTMPFVQDARVLCEMFPLPFRKRHNLEQSQIVEMVKKLQNLVSNIHKANVLIVDCSELNFLFAEDFSELYAIDSDSYQTPSFPATMITPSIRDPLVQGDKFSENSDWYSFGILSFQMFTGIHPFRGKHPSIKGMEDRMKSGISVLNKDVRIPKVIPPFDIIPPGYLDWFEKIFEKGQRFAPPSDMSGATLVVVPQVRHLSGQRVKITELFDQGSTIWGIYENLGSPLVVTSNGIFIKKIKVGEIPTKFIGAGFTPRENRGVVFWTTPEGRHLYGLKMFDSVDRKEIQVPLAVEQTMSAGGRCYVKVKTGIFEIILNELGGKITPSTVQVASCSQNATRLFDGVVIQELMGKTLVSLFPETKIHYQVHLPELAKYDKIVNARAERNVLMVLATKNGVYDRLVYRFSFRSFQAPEYDVRIVEDVPPVGLNFVVLDTGVVAFINEDEELEMFAAKRNHPGVKIVQDPVLGHDMILGTYQGKVCFWRGTKAYRLEAQ